MVNNISEIRKQKNLTQHELAHLVNVSVDHLKKVERGKRSPSLKLVIRIAKVLECKIDDLFFN